MSDLANSCEYLNIIDELCTLIRDNPKAKTFRQLNCKNSQNIVSCCYLCILRSQCVTSCKYLGKSRDFSEPQYTLGNTDTTEVKEVTVDVSQFENVLVAFCFSCNIEMVYAKTQFDVDNWQGNSSSGMLVSGKVLPVIVLLCPKCGKIEFKADIIREEVM